MNTKAVFLDRDNTIIHDPGYINHPDQVRLLPGAAESLRELRGMGYKIVIVTNQSAVARGIVTLEVLQEIHQRLLDILTNEDATVDRIYFCPYHPNGVIEEFRKDSDLRKPNPGMILKAAEEMNLDLGQSWMVGDSYSDISAGQRAGCRTILINSSVHPVYKKLGDPTPDKEAGSIREVVNVIKMFDRKSTVPSTEENRETQQVPTITNSSPTPPSTRTEEISSPADEKSAAPPHNQISVGKKSRVQRSQIMLEEVVRHLEGIRREGMYDEFSYTRVIAWIFQVVVVFCVIVSLWFLLDPQKGTASVHTTLAYAAVLQLMAICFFTMRK